MSVQPLLVFIQLIILNMSLTRCRTSMGMNMRSVCALVGLHAYAHV